MKQWVAERCLGKMVLDCCCGYGQFTLWLAEAGAHAFGIDISPVSIGSATQQALERGIDHKVHFLVMDAEETDFVDGFFDLVVIDGALHHLDLNRAYRELARILKPEGEIICREALRHNAFIHLYRKITPQLRSAWEVEHILGKHQIAMAREYFFNVEVAKCFHLATLAAVPFRDFRVFPRMLRALEFVDSVLLKTPVIKWQAWMAVFVLSHSRKSVRRDDFC